MLAHACDAQHPEPANPMGTITTNDGATIFFKDWGPKHAPPVVFHHGWPLSADDWDAQMLFFLESGHRRAMTNRTAGGGRPAGARASSRRLSAIAEGRRRALRRRSKDVRPSVRVTAGPLTAAR
ncbi:MAG TPA: alpha/beta hydrolase [Phycisphaerales bacterium]|nr:alpha/beta hydrolase [Phycisphaerales bacterium]